jgi:plastocyanin
MRSRLVRHGYLVVSGAAVWTALLTTAPALADGDEPSPSFSVEASSSASPSQEPSAAPTVTDPTPSVGPPGEDAEPADVGDTPTPSPRADDDRKARRKQTSGVDIVDNSFAPARITVDAGTTITWSSSGQNPHTVTADDGSFDSGTLQNGDSFSSTFGTPGSFAYYCELHGGPGGTGMSGVVIVRGADTGGTAGGGGTTATAGATDLPATGLDLTAAVVAAIVLTSLGVGSVLMSRRIACEDR